MNSETATIAGLLALLALDRSYSPFSIQLLVAQAYSVCTVRSLSCRVLCLTCTVRSLYLRVWCLSCRGWCLSYRVVCLFKKHLGRLEECASCGAVVLVFCRAHTAADRTEMAVPVKGSFTGTLRIRPCGDRSHWDPFGWYLLNCMVL